MDTLIDTQGPDHYPERLSHTIPVQYLALLKDMTQVCSSLPLWEKRIKLQKETVKAAYGSYVMV